MGHPAIDIDGMAPEARLALIGELWDSLRKIPDSIPVPDARREELNNRIEVSTADPERMARGDRGRFERAMGKVPDVEPDDGDS